MKRKQGGGKERRMEKGWRRVKVKDGGKRRGLRIEGRERGRSREKKQRLERERQRDGAWGGGRDIEKENREEKDRRWRKDKERTGGMRVRRMEGGVGCRWEEGRSVKTAEGRTEVQLNCVLPFSSNLSFLT